MSDYTGKVVAITGAANGIGKELARQFAGKGAKLALADIDAANLAEVEKDLQASGAPVFTSVLDVSRFDQMNDFAQKTFQEYGAVDLFFNNAGVIAAGSAWETPLNDWEWLFRVNVMGVVHGIKAFVPAMINQDKECRIINTASIAGLLTPENSPAYVASKFGAVGLTEVLELQLQDAGAKVKAHVVCPAIVQTDLNNCMRHRDPALYDSSDPYYKSEDFLKRKAVVDGSIGFGLPVATAVERIINGVEADNFFILTHPEYNPAVTGRASTVVSGIRPEKVKR